MSGVQSLREHLDRMTQELTQIKKIAIGLEGRDKEKTESAWDDLMMASKEISREWKVASAVEEIRNQREKRW
ncbi:MAG TPA: hypothetical protein C5S37_03355 [Methanophagales archaeon]|nr:hypothetical protein [Methanophagales archaeon]